MEASKTKSEISKFDPPENEKQKDAFISLYYVIVLLLFGVPMWYMTTTTYRASLPLTEISELSNSKIDIVIKVNIINFDGRIDLSELFNLQDKLLEEFEKQTNNKNAFVNLKHTGYVRQATKEESQIYQYAQSILNLDKITSGLDANAIYFIIVDEETSLLAPGQAGLIRSRTDRNVVLLRRTPLDKLQATIVRCVTELMTRAEDLNVVYRTVLEVPPKESLTRIPSSVRSFLTRARTAARYDWTFSLIVPNPERGSVPEWDFPRMEHFFLEPLVRKLAPFVAVSVSSQLIHGVQLEHVWPSKKTGTGLGMGAGAVRTYSREDLTHVVNGVESYLGSNSGLQFVAYIASGPDGTGHRLHLEGRSGNVDAFTVPRWGGMVIVNNASLPVAGEDFMRVFLPQIWALMGLDRPSSRPPLPLEPVDISGLSSWQLQSWLRERTVENVAITQVTLQSILVLLDKVVNMVIRDDVAASIHTATRLSRNALVALAATDVDNGLQIAFLSSKQALEAAETAFFHPSLLELLYFQEDQKIGIYIPLFVPVILPIFLAAFKAWPLLSAALFKHKID